MAPVDHHNQYRFRIAVDARFFRRETGGLGRYTRELLHALARIDSENRYSILLRQKDLEQYDIDAPNFKPELVDIPHFSLREQTRLAAFLNRQRYDLVHFLNPNHPILYRRPFLTTIHDLIVVKTRFTERATAASTVKARIFKSMMRRAVLSGRRTIAVSNFTAEDASITLRVPRSRLDVVYEGWPEPGKNQALAESELRRFLRRDEPFFLFVSQWRVHKGILTLLDAFAEFKRRGDRPHILVLGGRPDNAARSVSESVDLG
ncbi:MAG: glycosyltransferase, partial [Fimbriimonadaceae bacterium]